jgi:hypothetical protein
VLLTSPLVNRPSALLPPDAGKRLLSVPVGPYLADTCSGAKTGGPRRQILGETRDREVKNVSRKARNCPGFLKSPVAPAS